MVDSLELDKTPGGKPGVGEEVGQFPLALTAGPLEIVFQGLVQKELPFYGDIVGKNEDGSLRQALVPDIDIAEDMLTRRCALDGEITTELVDTRDIAGFQDLGLKSPECANPHLPEAKGKFTERPGLGHRPAQRAQCPEFIKPDFAGSTAQETPTRP